MGKHFFTTERLPVCKVPNTLHTNVELLSLLRQASGDEIYEIVAKYGSMQKKAWTDTLIELSMRPADREKALTIAEMIDSTRATIFAAQRILDSGTASDCLEKLAKEALRETKRHGKSSTCK